MGCPQGQHHAYLLLVGRVIAEVSGVAVGYSRRHAVACPIERNAAGVNGYASSLQRSYDQCVHLVYLRRRQWDSFLPTGGVVSIPSLPLPDGTTVPDAVDNPFR